MLTDICIRQLQYSAVGSDMCFPHAVGITAENRKVDRGSVLDRERQRLVATLASSKRRDSARHHGLVLTVVHGGWGSKGMRRGKKRAFMLV